MPQLIAMVIVVVAAMIYMFQTFGGTGDKIEGIAQKTSIVTEINNIKNGVQLAVRGGDVVVGTQLEKLANAGYFAEQINNQLIKSADNTGATSNDYNIYKAISFGGTEATGNGDMEISLVLPTAASTTARPGIKVDLSKGSLKANAGFLESQIATDLAAVASIDRTTTAGTAVALDANGNTPAANRPAGDGVSPVGTVTAGTATLSDGVFTIYFKDIPAGIN